jgi:FkbM family methyltransferase
MDTFSASVGNRLFFRPQDQCIVDEVYDQKVYSSAEIKPGEVVVDVGAHIGTFALMSARKVGPRGKVIAFEPSPKTEELLRRNLAANHLPWVSAHAVGLAEKEDTAQLFVADDLSNNPAADTLSDNSGRKSVSIRLRRLDDVMAEEKISSVDHMKIDVEGAELRVLDGAPVTLTHTRRILMEVHAPRVTVEDVRRRLEPLGFSCHIRHQNGDSSILEANRI